MSEAGGRLVLHHVTTNLASHRGKLHMQHSSQRKVPIDIVNPGNASPMFPQTNVDVAHGGGNLVDASVWKLKFCRSMR